MSLRSPTKVWAMLEDLFLKTATKKKNVGRIATEKVQWCVLQNDMLFYYEANSSTTRTPDKQHLLGSYSVSQIKSCVRRRRGSLLTQPMASQTRGGQGFTINFVGGKSVSLVAMATDVDVEFWVSELNRRKNYFRQRRDSFESEVGGSPRQSMQPELHHAGPLQKSSSSRQAEVEDVASGHNSDGSPNVRSGTSTGGGDGQVIERDGSGISPHLSRDQQDNDALASGQSAAGFSQQNTQSPSSKPMKRLKKKQQRDTVKVASCVPIPTMTYQEKADALADQLASLEEEVEYSH